jgi:hypothetical protein
MRLEVFENRALRREGEVGIWQKAGGIFHKYGFVNSVL